MESVDAAGFDPSGAVSVVAPGAGSDPQAASAASAARARSGRIASGEKRQAKRRRQIQTAKSVAARSAMSPAGIAWRVLVIPTAPK